MNFTASLLHFKQIKKINFIFEYNTLITKILFSLINISFK